jgi:anti-sigma-K factor RskA
MNHEEIRELLEAYTIGALDPNEHTAVETHLDEGCKECLTAVREASEIATKLALAVPQHAPSDRVKQGIMAQITSSDSARASRSGPWAPWVLTAIAAGLALFLGIRSIDQIQRISRLEQELLAAQDVSSLLQAPAMEYFGLNGVAPNQQAFGKVVIDPDGGSAVISMYKLPDTPDGMTYQLWAIRDGKPSSIGLFTVSTDGRGFLVLNGITDAKCIESFAVTIEPEGGTPEPSGMMYLTSP